MDHNIDFLLRHTVFKPVSSQFLHHRSIIVLGYKNLVLPTLSSLPFLLCQVLFSFSIFKTAVSDCMCYCA